MKNHERTVMRMQPMHIRTQTFEEVNLGYSKEEAMQEASRCLDCKHQPCVNGCPVGIDIPGFIKMVEQDRIDEAYRIIEASSCLPAVCGRVCPQETQCEAVCVRAIKGEPVAIGHLERYVADQYYMKHHNVESIKQKSIKVAVIGSGPAGLSFAHDVIKAGFQVDLYEALHTPGGVLSYGIPAFRLPKDVVKREVDTLIEQGVHLLTDVIIGKTLMLEDLHAMGYHAIFIGTGAGLPKFMNISGEMLNGVYSANEFLTRINLMKAYDSTSETPIKRGKRVAVIGGGNVALDAARAARRLGADIVYLVYRRGMQEIPARHEEVEHALEEGIIFKLLTQVKEIIGDENGTVKAISCCEMILGEPDASGRRRPIENPKKIMVFNVDEVIMAIGTTPNPMIIQDHQTLQATSHGCLVVNQETNETTIPMIFAGGDVVTGSATVILAMEAGRKAAKVVIERIQGLT
jgi:glutamate synthase (NADPH/NADH) small chain